MATSKYRHILTVHTGPMKSAKTLHLIQAYQHAQTAKRALQAFRPYNGVRTKEPAICTRFGNVCVPATLVNTSKELLAAVTPETQLVVVDEAQFFDADFPDVVQQLLFQCDVEVAGLDLDYRARPFGFLPQIMAMADHVHKYTPVCDKCGGLARFTQRLTNGKPARANEADVVGEGSQPNVSYEARCRKCYQSPR